MKAFDLFEETDFEYPEDMEQILEYLKFRGTLNVSDNTVERLYRKFSDKVYAASWMDVTIETLDEFADWLSNYEI